MSFCKQRNKLARSSVKAVLSMSNSVRKVTVFVSSSSSFSIILRSLLTLPDNQLHELSFGLVLSMSVLISFNKLISVVENFSNMFIKVSVLCFKMVMLSLFHRTINVKSKKPKMCFFSSKGKSSTDFLCCRVRIISLVKRFAKQEK